MEIRAAVAHAAGQPLTIETAHIVYPSSAMKGMSRPTFMLTATKIVPSFGWNRLRWPATTDSRPRSLVRSHRCRRRVPKNA